MKLIIIGFTSLMTGIMNLWPKSQKIKTWLRGFKPNILFDVPSYTNTKL